MGRSEVPLDPTAGPVQRFAFELRKLRQEADGITYREMARHAGYSVTALSRAAAGQQLPSWPVVRAYVLACGGDVADWQARWRQAADEQAAPPPAEAADEGAAAAPYPGLAPYDIGDHNRFFGRGRLLGQLAELLGRRRFAAVFGPSGSGKSSLLRAGLVPAARDGVLGGPVEAVTVLTPGEHPMREHAAALADGAGLVVVDQFEEVFTLCQDVAERGAFVDLLLATAGQGRVVVAVRADFYGRCAEHRALAEALGEASVLVGPMDRQELREAIVGPATAAGLFVERALTERVVEEVAGEAAGLPLMSHALLETWRRRRGRLLTLEGYERAGGVRGAIAATAERLYARLSADQADQARRILLRLVSPGERAADTRRPASHAELNPDASAEVAEVLERLAAARLVTVHQDGVELAHEALISSWPRLREWIDQERETLRVQRRLTEAAAAWQELGRDPGALYRGVRLEAARPLLARPRELTPLEGAFLEASGRAAAQAERAAVRRGRWARLAVAALAVLMLLASAAAVVAVSAARRADAQAKQVLARMIMKDSGELAATDPVLSGLLAVTSWHFAPTAEARHGMFTTLASSLRGVLDSHTGAVDTVAFSPDGAVLATADEAGGVRLWNTAAHRLIGVLPATPILSGVRALAFSPDGGTLAVAGVGVRLWGVATRRVVAILPAGQTNSLVFGQDGTTLRIVGDNGNIQLWDIAARRPIASPITTSAHDVTTVALSPDGAVYATVDNDGRRVRLWDLATRRVIGALPVSDHGFFPYVRFSPDGARLAVFGASETVRLWDVATRRVIGGLPAGRTNNLAFSPDGAMVATEGDEGAVRLWDTATRRLVGGPLIGHTDFVNDIVFSPDGGTLATAGADGTTRLWDTTIHRPDGAPLTGHAFGVNVVAFSPDGATLATAGDDRDIRLWDVATRRLVGVPLSGHDSGVNAVAFSPDGATLATAGDDRDIRLWDVATHRQVGVPLSGHGGGVNAVAFSPDGSRLATGSWDGTVRLWDVATRRLVGVPLSGHGDGVNAVAFSPDGSRLATGSWDGTVRLWDVATHRQVGAPLTDQIAFMRKASVSAVAFSPDGSILATTGEERTVRLWDVAAHHLIGAPLAGHTAPVSSAAFSSDGSILATTGEDRTIRLWDVAMRRPIGVPLAGYGRAVRAVAFSPDGATLASAGEDRGVRLWRLGMPSDPFSTVCAVVGRSLTPQEWQRYVPGQPFQQVCP
ncbi:hypothetical protein [Streptosporangium carneum]|uniref:HTH cro/C1-type domain-containing protein n=1 Tax=Streptosporangium carneum TaxID=47481 RepID=A0A9W6MAF9_9ACTN|nr:hypothetical protein [Streptosporangium carneum]GLK06670.1 hypothetical protein GCM10017600_00750 [Streptosporangium carneum]